MYLAKLNKIKQAYVKQLGEKAYIHVFLQLMWHKNNETLFHSNKFKSKLQGLKSVLHCNGGTCIRVTLRVMACILVSQRLPFLMSLCNLDVPLWSARMLAVSNSFQRDKRCQILSQCSAHGLLSLPHQLLQRLKKKDILTVYHIYIYTSF